MDFRLLFPSLLILAFTPAYGALSDATGLVNRFDIETGGNVFEITITSNFDVKNVDFDKDQKQLTLHIISSLENNLGDLLIPQEFLSGNFTFFLNDQQYFPLVRSNEKISFITLNFTGSGNNKLDVTATNYLKDEGNNDESQNQNSELIDENPSSEKGGCLIATATFDSELSLQVQNLRELRDNKLLLTKSGSEFMEIFNGVYYSFSPQVADLEREHSWFKETVKIGITPLILSLSLLNNAELNSDYEVIGYGFSIILLNLGIYFTVPALIVLRLTKR